MNARAVYLWLLGAAVVLFIASRTKQGAEVVAAVTDAVASNVRGIRNNNPGNVRRTGDAWQGLRAEQTDAAFCQFTDMKYGVRAACKVFRNYQSRYGLRTITGMIARWAPPSENDTGSYIASVAARVGVDPAADVNLFDPDTCYAFLRAVFRHECGVAAELIPPDTVREGIALA